LLSKCKSSKLGMIWKPIKRKHAWLDVLLTSLKAVHRKINWTLG
jgi:hypothetical protein